MSTTALVAILFFSSLCFVNGNNGDCDRDDIENDKYQNDPTEVLDFKCPSGYALYKVESCFDRFEDLFPPGRKKRSTGPFDRLWIWECRAVSTLRKEECTWSSQTNLEEDIIFQCPKNQYLAGVRSRFDDSTYDRLWSFRCCGIEEWCQKDCYLTEDFVNPIDENFEYSAEGDEKVVFTGLFSEFDDFPDRRFKFQECKFSLCGLDKIVDDCH